MRKICCAKGWRRVVLAVAALPLMQFFTGCFPNIPGLANLPGAINVELQNLIVNTLVSAVQTVLANLLNL